MAPLPEQRMVEVVLGRIVIREHADRQYVYLAERGGKRGFPIVIGTSEAAEIQRVVAGIECERPLTHQLAHSILESLGAKLRRCDIVDLRQNTFFAQLVLETAAPNSSIVIDARPSDAIALALRAGCPLRVAESVLEQARSDAGGPDPISED
ncbi:MAG TPA: bifunctional nuclease family protein [Planctomycetota bacterium]|nr:bifunctional nuclease family protein [Planctomycetota bacterium]